MNSATSDKEVTKGAGTRIQSVARASRLVLWIAQQPHGATAKDVAQASGLALPTTYHLLNTLVDEGLLTKDIYRRYVLGRSVGVLAQAYVRGRSVPESLFSGVRELARRTNETAYLADWGDNDIRVLASVEGNQMVRVTDVSSGPYDHGHARANGKVLLAYAAAELREAYLRNHPIVPVTPNTVIDLAQFEREAAAIRKRGYAYDEEEYALGLCCVAAPLLQNEHVICSFGLAVPAERFREKRAELTATLLDVVSRLTEPTIAATP
jgi:IclR family acetate operon transcriptional repressor